MIKKDSVKRFAALVAIWENFISLENNIDGITEQIIGGI
jgi:hypothetical protein